MPKPRSQSVASLSKLTKASSPDQRLSPMNSSANQAKGSGSISFGAKGMNIKSGGASLSLSAGNLSVKSGNTEFNINSLADGIRMQAKDTKTGNMSSFKMDSKGTEEVHKMGKSVNRTVQKTDQFSALSSSVSDQLWQQGRNASSSKHQFAEIATDDRRSSKSS